MIEDETVKMSYPIIHITAANVLKREDMGSKDKSWCRHPNDDRLWLFKHPRATTGEYWSEKVAAELGNILDIPLAQVELAMLDGQIGSFTRDIRASDDETLVHGNELLAGHIRNYDLDQTHGQRDHTWDNICAAISVKCGPERCQKILKVMAGYLVFDAWIGNTDRHHQNWALLQRRNVTGVSYDMCASFDHASSLGRELNDKRRHELLKSGINAYRHHSKARGAIYWTTSDSYPLPCTELVRRATKQLPQLFAPWIEQLQRLSSDSCAIILNKVSDDLMTPVAKKFSLALIEANRQDLLLCLKP